MWRIRTVPLLVVAFGVMIAGAHGEPAVVQRILEEGKTRNQSWQTINELAAIGPRLTGSPQLEQATDWAEKRFRDMGLQNVQRLQWGTIDPGFSRGPRQSVRMVWPFERTFVFSTPNWTVGTEGPVRGKAVLAPKDMADLDSRRAEFKGAWVLMGGITQGGMGGPRMRTPSDLDKAVDEAGIAGRVWHSNGDLVWTSGTWRDYTVETRPKTPLLYVRKQDYDGLARMIDRGIPPVLEVDAQNEFLNRAVPVYNIVGEIPGTERPDEVVIVCGHLDSWNGPGSQGASDNGTGVTTTMEAARILMSVGAKPKRTIRFILWTGEEQGLLGATAYVQSIKDQWPKIQAVLNEDAGNNWIAGIGGLKDMIPILRPALAPLADAFPGMPVAAREIPQPSRGGSDHAAFTAVGVPGFPMIKGGNLPYRFIWHTQNDRVQEIPPENLVQMSTVMAVMAYNLAEAPALLPRVPLPPPPATPPAAPGQPARRPGN